MYAVTHAADCIMKHEEASSKPICTGHGRYFAHYQQVSPYIIANDPYTWIIKWNKKYSQFPFLIARTE